jgi:hypothetical protein
MPAARPPTSLIRASPGTLVGSKRPSPRRRSDFDPPLCVLFDLDLYEPSAFALGWLAGHLKRGDLPYFDEAYDPWHERRLLDEFLDAGHRVRTVVSTGLTLMLEYQAAPS